MEIIGVIIAGIIIGLLGKFVAPGSRDDTSNLADHFVWDCSRPHRLVHLHRLRRQWQPRNQLGALAYCNCGRRGSPCRDRLHCDGPQHDESSGLKPALD